MAAAGYQPGRLSSYIPAKIYIITIKTSIVQDVREVLCFFAKWLKRESRFMVITSNGGLKIV